MKAAGAAVVLIIGAAVIWWLVLADSAVEAQQDTLTTVDVGEELIISLHENQSVGDQYEVRSPIDDAVVREVGREVVDPGTMEDGSGADIEFRFEAVVPGTVEIEIFNCFRCVDGEPDDSFPTEERRYPIEVVAP